MPPSATEQLEALRRGVDAIVPEDELARKLERSARTGAPLRVKYGIDPTGIDVHLGHTVPLRKLRQFQELGHTAVIIIGNYTALVGDPSGRDETRKALTEAQVEANAVDYLNQVGRIIDLDRAEVHRNGDWFGKWSFLGVLDLCRRMTLSQMIEREDFSKRIGAGKPVYLHECLYPLMQGWDSVEIRADVELGGSEQLFSLMVARSLQKEGGQEPQIAMTMPILVGTDGVRRMGKSLGNYIGVAESAASQYGKIMSIPDGPIRQYLMLLTDVAAAEIDAWLAPGTNPRDAKDRLARLVVDQYHGPGAGDRAAAEFRKVTSRVDPDEIPIGEVARSELDVDGQLLLANLIKHLGLEASTSAARRSIEQGSVTIGPDRQPVRDPKAVVPVVDGLIVRVGKVKMKQVKLI